MSKGTRIAVFTACWLVLLLAPSVRAQGVRNAGGRIVLAAAEPNRVEQRAGAERQAPRREEEASHGDSAVLFVPRAGRGAPAARVGAATRGEALSVVVRALVPRYDEAALTSLAQPTLYWDLSADTRSAVNFTLVDPEAIDPLVDVRFEGPFRAGVHRIDLARYGARLETGRIYQWFVAVVPDPARRSADIIARGALQRVDVDAGLRDRLQAAPPVRRTAVLARDGLWYEALASVAPDPEGRGEPASMQAWRSLLEQVGLSDVPLSR